MIKGFRQIAFLTAASRVFGMVRDMAFSHFWGTSGLMNVWTISFQLANLARRIFGEGAASASFIPIYSQGLHEDPQGARRFANTVVTVIFVLLSAIVLVGQAGIWIYYFSSDPSPGLHMGLKLSSIMLPYMTIICVVAILSGILNVHKHFAAPAAAPALMSIFIVAALVITGRLMGMEAQKQVYIVAVSVIVAGVVQLAIQIPPLVSSGFYYRPAWDVKSEAFRRTLLLMGPMMVGLAVMQINTFVDNIIASVFSNYFGKPLESGAVSYLYYAQRLYQFPLGVLGISLATAIFPVMSADAARKDFDALRKTISRGVSAAVFVAVPATAGIIMVARPLVGAIFEHGKFGHEDTRMTAWVLGCYCLGLCGYFSQQVTARAFYSTQDSKVPATAAVIAVCANFVLNLTLIWIFGTAGLAIATAICSYLQDVIMLRILRRRFGKVVTEGFYPVLVKTLAATALMVAAAMGILFALSQLPCSRRYDVVRILAVVPISVLVFFAASRFLNNPMLEIVIHPKSARQDSGVQKTGG